MKSDLLRAFLSLAPGCGVGRTLRRQGFKVFQPPLLLKAVQPQSTPSGEAGHAKG